MAEDEKVYAESRSRKGLGAMNDEEFESIVRDAIEQSAVYTDEELSPIRAQATEYYLGQPFGNEEEGRSQVVLSEVRDAVLGVLPSAMRVIFGPEHPVEFMPRRADAVATAAQATDYVRYVFSDDNPGLKNTYAVWKDGLVRKMGIFKIGWDASAAIKAYRLEGVTGEELRQMAADEDITFTKVVKSELVSQEEAGAGVIKPMAPPEVGSTSPVSAPTAPTDGPEPLYDVELTKRDGEGRARIWTVPPEEFIFNREARDDETALLLAHRFRKTRGELIDMGIDEDAIDEISGNSEDDGASTAPDWTNVEVMARMSAAGTPSTLGSASATDPAMGPANNKIIYVEGYMRLDYDGDGVAELRKVCTIGEQYKVVYNKPCDSTPFYFFMPDPEPHTFLGQSWADRLMDMQRISSFLMRGALDSLSASIYPRTTYEEGQASVADIMNTAIGAPIRIRKPGAVQSFNHNFLGDKAFPYLDKVQDIIERRTGRNKGVAGLDADALQSTTKDGVQAAISGSQEQAEMLVRLFTEYTLKPLFKGLLRLLVEHQPRKRLIRLRGEYVEVDPRAWDVDMDVRVNVALGSGFTEKKIAILKELYAEQKSIIQEFGVDNPIVTVAMARNTLAKILELEGIMDTETYLKAVPPDWTPPPQQPAPTPEQTIAQAQLQMEQIKAQRSLAEKKDELSLKEKQMDLDHAFKLRELAENSVLKRYQIDAQFHAAYTAANMADDTKREIAEIDATLEAHTRINDAMTQVASTEPAPAEPAPAEPAPTEGT